VKELDFHCNKPALKSRYKSWDLFILWRKGDLIAFSAPAATARESFRTCGALNNIQTSS
jgi:hypothetical protein